MSRRTLLPGALFCIVLLVAPGFGASKPKAGGVNSKQDFSQYTEIPGAEAVGADQCAQCHDELAKGFRHGLHALNGVTCEQCHGAGSLHVAEGAYTKEKIISFRDRAAEKANGVCLSCHVRDASVRNWMTGKHASNRVRCTDCHQIHAYAGKTESRAESTLDLVGLTQTGSVENLVPETKTRMQSRGKANEACLRCHETQRGQMSLPYHHPLREGKMSCADCHDPHGGAGGNNLRAANKNQLCLSCHAQYRGPFAYQHPPVTEDCMICHSAHGSPNTNLLNVSEPALCLQCHAGHHNGAGLPIADRCTNCHAPIHGTDTPTPSGGSRFLEKGPSDPQLRSGAFPTAAHPAAAHSAMAISSIARPVASHVPVYPFGAAGGALGLLAQSMTPMSGEMQGGGSNPGSASPGEVLQTSYGSYSFTPASYRFLDQSGFGGRVGEYDTLKQSAGADLTTSYVSLPDHVTLVTRANAITSEDYQIAAKLNVGKWLRADIDTRSLMQQQDTYQFYAFPVLDAAPPGVTPPAQNCLPSFDCTTQLIPSHTTFGVVRRLGNANVQAKLPKLPVHLFANFGWQARSGTTQLTYMDENSLVPPQYPQGCGIQCHYQSQFQPVNYTTRNVGGGGDVDLGPVRLTYQHKYSSFNDRLTFPTGTFTEVFSPESDSFGYSSAFPVPAGKGPTPIDINPGNYSVNIPSPSVASTDSVSLNWTASPSLIFNGNVSYARLRNRYTSYPQNAFDTDNTLIWRPLERLRLTGDYHQQNVINNFTPYYTQFGNVSYHNHREGVRAEYELPRGFDVEGRYQHGGITRSNAALWPQLYSVDNTDLLTVVPSSSSNTLGLALRYHDRGLWSARAGYDWTGTHHPGYLIVPTSDNRLFTNVTLTPKTWLVFANDFDVIAQNAFPAVPLPNTPNATPNPPPATQSFGFLIQGLPPTFQRSNRFYTETLSATLRLVPEWSLGLGYSYQQSNLKTYIPLQNDNATGYILDEPLVPYKQLSQTYWGDSTYTYHQRLGLNLRLTYNSARSGLRPDLNPNNAALFGNQALISQGTFSPDMFALALNNANTISTQISEVIVPQWIGQTKAYYQLPHKMEGGLIFYYGSSRDHWNPGLNGVLRTFNVYVGRSW